MAMSELQESEKYKVLVIGDYGVGKTSIIRRYMEGVFNPKYKLTIGVDFSSKILDVDGHRVDLQLWDIAGHERCVLFAVHKKPSSDENKFSHFSVCSSCTFLPIFRLS